jgi:hypothetical protein
MSYPRPQLSDEQLLGAHGEIITLYRSDLHAITGSVYAALFLAQTLYWWTKMGRRPFYKYAAPCASARPGDSWQEELNFTRHQFETARAAVGARCRTGDSKTELLKTHLVIWWVDDQNRTWYEVNEALLAEKLGPMQSEPDAENPQPISDAVPSQPTGDADSPQPIAETTKQENTLQETDDDDLARLLESVEIQNPTRDRLLKAYPPEHLIAWVEYYRREKRKGRPIGPGLLVSWIRSGEPPKMRKAPQISVENSQNVDETLWRTADEIAGRIAEGWRAAGELNIPDRVRALASRVTMLLEEGYTPEQVPGTFEEIDRLLFKRSIA